MHFKKYAIFPVKSATLNWRDICKPSGKSFMWEGSWILPVPLLTLATRPKHRLVFRWFVRVELLSKFSQFKINNQLINTVYMKLEYFNECIDHQSSMINTQSVVVEPIITHHRWLLTTRRVCEQMIKQWLIFTRTPKNFHLDSTALINDKVWHFSTINWLLNYPQFYSLTTNFTTSSKCWRRGGRTNTLWDFVSLPRHSTISRFKTNKHGACYPFYTLQSDALRRNRACVYQCCRGRKISQS